MTPRTSIHSSRQLVRPRGTAELIHLVLGRLTPRDWQLIRLLHEHRVLTTQHVCDALFPSKRRAEMRLLDLYRLRVVDRFRPFSRTGSEPYHWVLDEIGAQLIAWDRGVDMKKLGWRRERALGIAASRQLAHTLGVDAFFCALMREARQTPGCRLASWRSNPDVRSTHTIVKPDGFGVWQDGGWRLPFYLEYDRGTERLERLHEKVQTYARVVWELRDHGRADTSFASLVLFVFPGPWREAGARRVLHAGDVAVATAIEDPGWRALTPAAAVWAPVGGTRSGRRPLIELAGAWGDAGRTSATPANDDAEADDDELDDDEIDDEERAGAKPDDAEDWS
jgi:hypothetical protein